MSGGRAPVTAIVASRNEADLLDRRLRELEFCDEVIVIDIESTDATADVAAAHGRRVVRSPYVPIAEVARARVAEEARHDWLLLNDPDEEIPSALAAQATEFLRDPPADVAVVYAPIAYLLRGRPLRGTVWGGTGARPLLVRRSAVELSTDVHVTFTLREGYRGIHIEATGDNVIRHDWAPTYRQWIAKHRRYIPLEGRTRASRGYITGYRGVARAPWSAFRHNFVHRRGYQDGVRGLVVSVLWALYSLGAEVALFRELRRRASL